MRLREGVAQAQANLRKVVQIETLGLCSTNFQLVVISWQAPCVYAYCEMEVQCEEA